MRVQDRIAIDNMRLDGHSAADIAIALKLSPNTVRSHIRRHPEIQNARKCLTCGKPVLQTKGRREKKFCSDMCRMAWWNSHPEDINRKAYYSLVCNQCEKEFESYGNKNRKYCCRACYLASLRG
jgi:endogenous inhibitor of DNA gyrase (YacG/DUF329 family)